MSGPTIRPAAEDDVDTIKQIAVDARMFDVDEVEFFDEMLGGFFDHSMDGHRWLVVEDDGTVVASANFAPEPFADRMWNLYFIAVTPERQRDGLGAMLMGHVEDDLAGRGPDVARVLVVETSSTDQYAPTREFYRRLGYDEEARIRQFYGPDDDKIVFWKSLVDDS